MPPSFQTNTSQQARRRVSRSKSKDLTTMASFRLQQSKRISMKKESSEFFHMSANNSTTNLDNNDDWDNNSMFDYSIAADSALGGDYDVDDTKELTYDSDDDSLYLPSTRHLQCSMSSLNHNNSATITTVEVHMPKVGDLFVSSQEEVDVDALEEEEEKPDIPANGYFEDDDDDDKEEEICETVCTTESHSSAGSTTSSNNNSNSNNNNKVSACAPPKSTTTNKTTTKTQPPQPTSKRRSLFAKLKGARQKRSTMVEV